MSDDALIDAVGQAVERAPDVVVLRAHLAQLLVDNGRYAEAVMHCGVCLSQDPPNQLAFQMLERCLVALKGQARWTEAKRAVREPAATSSEVDQQPTTILASVRHAADSPSPPVDGPIFESLAAGIDEMIWSLDHPPKHAADPSSSTQPTAAATREIPALAQRRQVVAALVDFVGSGMDGVELGPPSLTRSSEADRLVLGNPFAFLVGVLFDQSISVERAWRAPYDLQARLGHLDPRRIADDPDSMKRAITTPPNLHHFGEHMTSWIVAAAIIVCDRYDGDASAIWQGNPTAREVEDRLEQFPGIGEAKAAMAVQMLCRDFDVPIRELRGIDAAYDVHVRRVLLRTGLAYVDELDHMRAVVRTSDPTSGAGIALPAWQVGRTWCRPKHPRCESCPLADACPKHIDPAADQSTVARVNGRTSFPQWADGNCA